MNHKRVINITDRRSGKKSAPHVPSKGGAQPRSRTKSGRWRKKDLMLRDLINILNQKNLKIESE